MKKEIKQFMNVITRKRTQDLFHENITDVVHKGDHVVFYVDNAGPLHELNDPSHDAQIKKAVDHVCGEGCTYEVKIAKSNAIHERAKHVMRQQSPRMRQ